MKKFLVTGALVCVLFSLASAGPGETGGAEPTPSPSPCPESESCDAGGSGVVITSDGTLETFLIDGALLVISILP